MSMTNLDLQTALIVIDMQRGIASLPTIHPIAAVTKNASKLTDAFRKHNLPVVLVNVTGVAPGRAEVGHREPFPADFADLLPELGRQPRDHVVSKSTWGAFTGTNLEKYLRDAGMTQVVLCGVATSVGVESTARYAHELGFHVTVAVDAVTDVSAAAHANSLTHIFPRLGETGTTREILELLAARPDASF